MIYDPMASPFSDIMSATKARAMELWKLRLFDALAIEWHTSMLGKVSVQLVAQRLGARRWSLRELFRAKRPRATSLAPPGWISGRSVRIHEVAHRTLIELPDTQKGQEPGGGDVLDFRAL